MKFAYADPPYPGCAKRLYGCEEVDHSALIQRLCDEFPDGWALSTSSSALRDILPMTPPKTRIAAWCKTWTALALPVRFAWEPVLFFGGRQGNKLDENRCRDWHVGAPAMGTSKRPSEASQRTFSSKGKPPEHFAGVKPRDFCFWVFRLLGAQPGDDLHDLFPGTGAVGNAWREFVGQGVLWEEAR